jgi:16S rRNA A1518/A1519 N6-dimethyltransferase RsmA/KsgA/DIM1 with predicted DNA glycosylase/AP lyase activity
MPRIKTTPLKLPVESRQNSAFAPQPNVSSAVQTILSANHPGMDMDDAAMALLQTNAIAYLQDLFQNARCVAELEGANTVSARHLAVAKRYIG